MDTTPEYIKMCEKAGEIQEEWMPDEGDVFFIKNGHFSNGSEPCNGETWYDRGDIVYCGDGVYPNKNELAENNYVWLPRQDQLQEILSCSIGEGMNRLWVYFHEWFCKIGAVEYSKSSWERLWLAFVMEKKYGKVWNGEEWEVI